MTENKMNKNQFFNRQSEKWKLSDNNIGDEGARMISEALKKNTILTELWLDGDI